jgi:hypothetical protein
MNRIKFRGGVLNWIWPGCMFIPVRLRIGFDFDLGLQHCMVVLSTLIFTETVVTITYTNDISASRDMFKNILFEQLCKASLWCKAYREQICEFELFNRPVSRPPQNNGALHYVIVHR